MPKHTPYSPGDTIESSKTNEDIDGLSTGENDTDNNSLQLFRSEILSNFVGSGLVGSIISGLQAGFTSGSIYYGGVRVSVNALGSHTFSASKWTYVDVSNAGVYAYPEGDISGAAPAVTTDSVRIACVATNASAITNIWQSGTDTSGNLIYPKAVLGDYRSMPLFAQFYRSGDAVVTGEQWRHITFNTFDMNNGFKFDTAAAGYPIIIPKAGFYRFGGRAGITGGPDGQELFGFNVNTTSQSPIAPYLYRIHRNGQNPFSPPTSHFTRYFNAGDELRFCYYANGTANHRLKGGLGTDCSYGEIIYLGG